MKSNLGKMMKKSFLFSALLAASAVCSAWGADDNYNKTGFILKCNDTSCLGDGCKILQKDLNQDSANFNFGDETADEIQVKDLRTTYQLQFKDLSVSRNPANHESNQMVFKIIPGGLWDRTEHDTFKVTVRVYGDVHREGEDRAEGDPHIKFAFMTSDEEKFYNYFLQQEYEFFKNAEIAAYYNIGLNKYGEPKWNEEKKINEYFRYDDENLQKSQRYWRKKWPYVDSQKSDLPPYYYYDQVILSQYDYKTSLDNGKYSGSVCLNFDNTRYLDAYKAAIAAGKYPTFAWYGWSGWEDCLSEQKAAGKRDYMYQCALKATDALSKNNELKNKNLSYEAVMKLTPRYKFSLYGLGNGVGGSEKPEGFWNKALEYTSGTENVPVTTKSICLKKTKSYDENYIKLFFQVDGTDKNGKYLDSIKCEDGDCSSKYNNYMLDNFDIVVTPADDKCNDVDDEVPDEIEVEDECGMKAFVINKWDARSLKVVGGYSNAYKRQGYIRNGDYYNVTRTYRQWGRTYGVYEKLYLKWNFKDANGQPIKLAAKVYDSNDFTKTPIQEINSTTFEFSGKSIQTLVNNGVLYYDMLVPNTRDKNTDYRGIRLVQESNFLSNSINSANCKDGLKIYARPAKFAINLSDSARVYSYDSKSKAYKLQTLESGSAKVNNNDLIVGWDYNFDESKSGNANTYLAKAGLSKDSIKPNQTPLIRNFVALDYTNEIVSSYADEPNSKDWSSSTTSASGVSSIGGLIGGENAPFSLNNDGSAGMYSLDDSNGLYFKFNELGGTLVSLLDNNYLKNIRNEYCLPNNHSNLGDTTTVKRSADFYEANAVYESSMIGCDIALDRDPLNTNYETKTNTYAEYYSFKPFGVLVTNTLKNYTDNASYTYYADIENGDAMGARLHTTLEVIGADGELLSLYNGGTRTAKTYNNATNKFEETKAEGYAQDATVKFDFSEAFGKISSGDKKDIRIYPASSNANGEIKCVSSSGATDCDSYYNSAEYASKAGGEYEFSIPKEYFTAGKADVEFIINLGRDDTPKNPIVIDINKTADALKTTTEVKFETSGGTNEKVEQKSETDGGDATFVYGSIQLSDNECYKGEKCEIEATVTIYCDDNCKADASNGDGDDEKIKELIEKLGEKYPNVDNQYGDKEINKIADNPLTDGHTNGEKGGENSGKTTFNDTYNEDNIQFTGDDVYTRALGNSAKPTKEKPNKTGWHGYGSEGDVLGDEKTDDGMSKGHKTQKRITW